MMDFIDLYRHTTAQCKHNIHMETEYYFKIRRIEFDQNKYKFMQVIMWYAYQGIINITYQ